MVAKIHGVPYLVGLTIAGYHCGVEDGLYTLVPAQMKWIEYTLRGHDPDFEPCFPEQQLADRDPLAFRFMRAEDEEKMVQSASCVKD